MMVMMSPTVVLTTVPIFSNSSLVIMTLIMATVMMLSVVAGTSTVLGLSLIHI